MTAAADVSRPARPCRRGFSPKQTGAHHKTCACLKLSLFQRLALKQTSRTRNCKRRCLKDTIFLFKTLHLSGQKGVLLGVKDSIFRSETLYLLIQKTVSFTPRTLYLSDQKIVSFGRKHCIFWTDFTKDSVSTG